MSQSTPADRRRETIFAHASTVFASKGFAGTRIADVAEAAKMSQGLLYRYFDSKDALFTELIRESFEKLNAATVALEKMTLPAHEKIAFAMQQIIHGMQTDPAFPERVLLIAQASISDAIPTQTRSIILSERLKPYQAIARIMKIGQTEGKILPGDPRDLSTLFWTAIKGLALHKVSFGDSYAMPDVKIIARMFLR